MNEPRISNVDPSTTGDPMMLAQTGYFVARPMGGPRWLHTLNIDHHPTLAGAGASLRGTAEPFTEAAE